MPSFNMEFQDVSTGNNPVISKIGMCLLLNWLICNRHQSKIFSPTQNITQASPHTYSLTISSFQRNDFSQLIIKIMLIFLKLGKIQKVTGIFKPPIILPAKDYITRDIPTSFLWIWPKLWSYQIFNLYRALVTKHD